MFTGHSGLDPSTLAWSCVKRKQKLNGHELLLHNTFTVTAQLSKAHGALQDVHHFCNWHFLAACDQCKHYNPSDTAHNLIRYKALSAETKIVTLAFAIPPPAQANKNFNIPARRRTVAGSHVVVQDHFTVKLNNLSREGGEQSWILSFLPRTQIYPEKCFAQSLSIQHSQQ